MKKSAKIVKYPKLFFENKNLWKLTAMGKPSSDVSSDHSCNDELLKKSRHVR